ncbi:MAG: RecQ family ATP-dependent DNA helicase [Clostridia bacterium]|nr:RecQ family ATP-dependent DNA helicase [Clostridia bacterium]
MDKHSILKQIFGHDEFREGQEGMIDQLLNGYDVLGVMPTGAGKSICYQIPALLMEGITLVISPLISLMKDQVMSLKACGVPAAYINSSLTPGQQAEAIRRAGNGAYKVIYVAPERLEMPSFVWFAQHTNISLLAVDEAHCVSQWGHDFRPSYLHIAEFIEKLPKRPPVAAFTATATRQVRTDIIQLLRLQEPYCLTTGFNRPNLRFGSVKPTDKFNMLLSFLGDTDGDCGIVYCNTRKTVEDVTLRLIEEGYIATRYHAGLTDAERQANQDAFQYDRAKIMVATNAFGMGIDKSNVRFVVHYNMPRNLESYYQEAGRAGRDGQPAECLLLYSGQDVITGKWMIEHSDENSELTPEQREAVMKLDMEKLKQMTYYATSKSCLRQYILRYFGEQDVPQNCSNCSVCDDEPFEVDTGRRTRRPRTEEERRIRREERVVRRGERKNRRMSEVDGFTAWERALFENLKMLRQLIASERSVPAYTVFSDAALIDMVRKHPTSMDAFLDVSGVGLVKQEQYGQVFLAVIRDGREPNEAINELQDYQKQKLIKSNKNALWTDAEENQLRSEYEAEMPLREIARTHERTVGGIRARLQKLGLIE